MNCRVYWGTHGCRLERGHPGDCLCSPTCQADGVGKPPYYGPDTRFYGKDVQARGLPRREAGRP